MIDSVMTMTATTFTTQRQLMMKNMPASALDNPFAQQQKVLLYVLPLIAPAIDRNGLFDVAVQLLRGTAKPRATQRRVERVDVRGHPGAGFLAARPVRKRIHSRSRCWKCCA